MDYAEILFKIKQLEYELGELEHDLYNANKAADHASSIASRHVAPSSYHNDYNKCSELCTAIIHSRKKKQTELKELYER